MTGTATRPNVLWLMSDQHNAACLSHAGRRVRTPNLDWLASNGVRFTQAFCNNPICAPSRISYITGRYPHSHRHLGNNLFQYPERNPETLAAVARQHGYQTALVGKAHMIRGWDEEGFEHVHYCDLCDADRDDPLSNHYFRYLYDNGLADRYDFGTLPAGHPGRGTQWFVSEIRTRTPSRCGPEASRWPFCAGATGGALLPADDLPAPARAAVAVAGARRHVCAG